MTDPMFDPTAPPDPTALEFAEPPIRPERPPMRPPPPAPRPVISPERVAKLLYQGWAMFAPVCRLADDVPVQPWEQVDERVRTCWILSAQQVIAVLQAEERLG